MAMPQTTRLEFSRDFRGADATNERQYGYRIWVTSVKSLMEEKSHGLIDTRFYTQMDWFIYINSPSLSRQINKDKRALHCLSGSEISLKDQISVSYN